MPSPFEISDVFTEKWADLSPIQAAYDGIPGRDHLCTDLSPEGHGERHDLNRETKEQLVEHLEHSDPVQRFAAKVLTGYLDEKIGAYQSKRYRRDLNHIASPFQDVRDVFDVMAKETKADWGNVMARLDGFSQMLDGYRRCLQEGVSAGDTVAVRQAESVQEQAAIAASGDSMFLSFVEEAVAAGVDEAAISRSVDSVREACGEFADWMRQEYLPHARPGDAVGEERYLEGAEEFLGIDIDLRETYEWGWSEIHRIREEMRATSGAIDASLSLEDVIELLDTDPARSAATRQEFTEFVEGIQLQAIDQLAGEHFDVPEQLRSVNVNIAPPGVPLGAWYHAPSEDFSRPGSIWYAPGERERLPYWKEVSTAYHEGFPGHHLQVGTAVLERERLSRFQRVSVWKSGSGEGWALYAERLMDELGFFEKPEYRLGLLVSQLFRSIRVVVDIGCQLELTIPDDAPLYPGEVWDFDRAVDYMDIVGLQPRDMCISEVKRYLGWYGQAISYKVGEREIMAMRDRVQAREGSGFDRKDFHGRVLAAGAIRLDHLWEEVVG